MGYQLGIDVGTTYTAAAVCRSSDRPGADPEVVTLGTRGTIIPSVLYLADDGAVVVGEAAQRRALTDPDRVVREFKRRIGDSTPIVVGGWSCAAEELSAHLVRWVVDQVAQREGTAAERIALTHPASWGDHKKELLTAALAAQGLHVTLLAEPQAAALHYATQERIPAGSTIAVYDLGGGTFDAAVVRKAGAAATASDPADFGLLGRPEGLDRLGGMDFDEVVFEHVRAGLPDTFTELDDTDPDVLSAVARVRRECTEAKEALSADTDAAIPVLLPGGAGSVRLHRSEFETLIRPYVGETVEALRTAVASAGCSPAALTAVLLVGGSSRIPLVAQMVSDGLGRPVAVDTDPKNAIAKGAALSVTPVPSAVLVGAGVTHGAGATTVSDVATVAFGTVAGGGDAVAAVAGLPSAAGVDVGADEDADVAAGRAGPPRSLDRSTGQPAPHAESATGRPRRPVGLFAGVSGLLAVVVVVLAVVLVPRLGASAVSPGILVESGSGGGSATATPDPGAPPLAGPARVAVGARGFGATGGDAERDPASRAGTPGVEQAPVGPPAAAGVPAPAAQAASSSTVSPPASPPGGHTSSPRKTSSNGPTSAPSGGSSHSPSPTTNPVPTGGHPSTSNPSPTAEPTSTPPTGGDGGGPATGTDSGASAAPAAAAPAPVVVAPAPASVGPAPANPVASLAVSGGI